MTEITLSFLFTDIEGSSRYWDQQPEVMRRALARHDEILRSAIAAQGGRVFHTAGDAFCAAFPNAPATLAAAVQAQQALSGEPWELDRPMRVRMVIHTGEVRPKGDDYQGPSLNRLGRMLQVCHGGQILLSMAAEELAHDRLPEGVSLLDLGRHRFRDLVSPETLFQVLAPGLTEAFPPLTSLDATPNNLPIQLTRFIGRETELAEVTSLIASTRLLTLTGPGGTGKTRLALQASAETLPGFPDGAWLVELAPLADPETVLPGIAALLKVRSLPETTWMEVLSAYLRSRSLLLLLDNCEHLIETCARLSGELLSLCPGLKILASSREPLGIAGEIVYRVPSLTLPASQPASPDDLLQAEAARLFVDRATALQPRFRLTPQNASAIAQICLRLDGIPLALELAAARVRIFTPEQIAARLDDTFRLLTGGSRSALPRQQTLEALIDWSYDLLQEDELILFRRLAVFAGGWTFEAAESLWTQFEVSAAPALDVPPSSLDLLEQLVNKSLVQVDDETMLGESRFNYLETIRQYARSRLLASGEMEAARDVHLAFFSALIHQASKEVLGARQAGWLQRLDRELDNIRTALDWALQRDPVLGLEMSGELALFWDRRGHGSEGLRWLQEGMKHVSSMPPEQGESLLRRKRARAAALLAQGLSQVAQGAYGQAMGSLKECVAAWREIGDRASMAFPLAMLGFQHSLIGDMPAAVKYAEEALAIANETGEEMAVGLAMSALAREKTMREHDYEAGRVYAEEGARRLRASGNEWFAHTMLMGIGLTGLLQGNLSEARSRLQESFDYFDAFGDRHFANVTRSGLAEVARAEGDYVQANRLYSTSATEWVELGNRGGAARCLECLAFLAIAQAGQLSRSDRAACEHRAAVLLGAAEAIRQVSRAVMVPEEQEEYDRQLAGFREWADPGRLQAAWAEGGGMSIEQALEFARQGL